MKHGKASCHISRKWAVIETFLANCLLWYLYFPCTESKRWYMRRTSHVRIFLTIGCVHVHAPLPTLIGSSIWEQVLAWLALHILPNWKNELQFSHFLCWCQSITCLCYLAFCALNCFQISQPYTRDLSLKLFSFSILLLQDWIRRTYKVVTMWKYYVILQTI